VGARPSGANFNILDDKLNESTPPHGQTCHSHITSCSYDGVTLVFRLGSIPPTQLPHTPRNPDFTDSLLTKVPAGRQPGCRTQILEVALAEAYIITIIPIIPTTPPSSLRCPFEFGMAPLPLHFFIFSGFCTRTHKHVHTHTHPQLYFPYPFVQLLVDCFPVKVRRTATAAWKRTSQVTPS
jgi:hypothetical protein